jgi:hypothetical protein
MKIAFLLIIGGKIRVDQIQRPRCVSDLSVFMEYEQRVLIHFLFKQGVSSIGVYSRLKARFADDTQAF